jgi:drug/metabolite transporter (DMT)-like permease
MAVLLGLCVALTYGAADFCGGVASRRSSSATVALWSQSVGLIGAVIVALIVGWDEILGADLARGAGAGIAQLVGVIALYRGLAMGRMGVVAPVSAVISATLPVAWGLAQGEDPSALALAGVAVAVVAIAIVARAPDPEPRDDPNRGLLFALLAGFGFGVNFICFAETSEASGMLPVVTARLVAVPLVLLALLLTRTALQPHRKDRPIAMGTGALDVTANAFLITAVRGEMMSLVAPIASLYPAGTVLLARVVLDEPIGRVRLAGLGLAVVGLVFIAI